MSKQEEQELLERLSPLTTERTDDQDLQTFNETVQIQQLLQEQSKPQNICVQVFSSILNFLNPKSHSQSGSSRLISIDVLRGISIFLLIIMHEANRFGDVASFTNLKMPFVILVYLVGCPAFIFAQWRSFFVLLSGLVYSFLNANQPTFKQASLTFVKKTVFSLLLLPLYFTFNQINGWLWAIADNVNLNSPLINIFSAHWYEYVVDSQSCIFFGLIFTVIHVFAYVIDIIALSLQKCKAHNIFHAKSLLYLILALLSSFISNQIQFATYIHLKSIQPNQFISMLECPANNLRTPANQREGFQKLLFSFISGTQLQMFPLITNMFLGCMLGSFLLGIKTHKLNENNNFNQFRKKYLIIFGFSFVIPMVMWGIQSGITIFDIKKGKRTQFQSIMRFKEGIYSYYCLQPEMVLFDDILQFIVVFAFVVYFDGCSNEQSVKRTNRTLYLRRLSTASLTCYVWSMLLGCIIRGYLPYNKANIFQFVGLEILYFTVQLVLLIGLDSADWIWTPDWLASSIPKMCTKKFKKGQFVNNNHLCVKSYLLFQKDQQLDEPIQ
ncbi:Transmembrane_domain-containing protein [Hexamita inflata]|uniref:Transmembrane domain-containing protein n=1 Tax=Hexamita inflata TaxID=28002 RepID=A0AA86UB64_9EUKA|nr:Transmembrane domain-containing protein [Hexamita inflata]